MIKNWDRTESKPLLGRIGGSIRPSDKSVKEKITAAVFRLKTQQNKLEFTSLKMQQRNKELFQKCIDAQVAKDVARASMYAEECAEIRKIAKVTLQCELAIEQAAVRLEAVQAFGDMASSMAPVAGVIRSLGAQISGLMPEVSYELGLVGETLKDIVVEVGGVGDTALKTEATSEEARKILTEASAIAEQKVKERFPEFLSGTSTPVGQERSAQPPS